MSEWRKVTIGELVTLRQGFAINAKSKHYISKEQTSLALLRIADMKSGSKEIFVKEDIPQNFIAKPQDIIYTRTGNVGLVFRNNYGVVHNNCFTVTPNDEWILSRDFLYYLLQSQYFFEKANSLARGAAQPDLPHSLFNSIEISYPSLQVQNKIATILSRYDSLIENYQKQIKLLEESAQRLYKEWFIDFRFPGHENTKIVDGVPEGWEKKILAEIANVVMGQSPKSEFYNKENKGLPFHQGVGSYGVRFVEDNIYCTSVTRVARPNSILFSVRAPVGRLNITKNKIIIGRGLAAMTHRNGCQSFLFYMLKERFFKDDIIGNGAIFASISKDELLNLDFITPQDDLVYRYNEITQKIDENIKSLDSQIRHLIEARNRLLPKLMCGEVIVNH